MVKTQIMVVEVFVFVFCVCLCYGGLPVGCVELEVRLGSLGACWGVVMEVRGKEP